MSAQVLRFGDTGFAANANRSGCLVRTDLQRRRWHKYTQLFKHWGFICCIAKMKEERLDWSHLTALNSVKAIMQAEQMLPLRSHSQQFRCFRGSGWYKSGKLCHYCSTACSPESNRDMWVRQWLTKLSLFSMCRYATKHQASVGLHMLPKVPDLFRV